MGALSNVAILLMLSLVRTFFFLFFLLGYSSALDVAFNKKFQDSLPVGTVQIVGVGDTTTRNFSVVPQFFPINTKRNVGETISFRFFTNSSQIFTVTEGTLESPCTPKPGGFSSGNITNPKDFDPTSNVSSIAGWALAAFLEAHKLHSTIILLLNKSNWSVKQ